jgi:molecular chaperone Hsp33
VGDDVTEYFASSEQTPTVCALGVRVNADLTVKSAGGFLLQLLPGADEALIPRIEENIGKMDSVSALLAAGAKGTDVIGAALDGIKYDIFDSFETSYKCDCCRDRYLRGLIGLPDSDKEELRAAGEPVETVCRFCGKKYTFDTSEF